MIRHSVGRTNQRRGWGWRGGGTSVTGVGDYDNENQLLAVRAGSSRFPNQSDKRSLTEIVAADRQLPPTHARTRARMPALWGAPGPPQGLEDEDELGAVLVCEAAAALARLDGEGDALGSAIFLRIAFREVMPQVRAWGPS